MNSENVRLSVNLNKVALIRNSRGSNLPDLLKVARDCEAFGADGITIHPRPDQRHSRYDDIPALKDLVKTELNVEGNPTKEFLQHVLAHKPHQCTLVPDNPDALTSDNGWDTVREKAFLSDIIEALKENGIRSSIFINPLPKMVEGAAQIGADRVEFYTGPFAGMFKSDREKAVELHTKAALVANSLNIGLNAGHDLNLQNLRFYVSKVPQLIEVSIGHALICDALYYGLSNVIGMYKHQLRPFED